MKPLKSRRSLHEEYLSLVDDARDKLFRAALAILGNEADAADAVSEAVCRGYKAYPSLKQKEFGVTWLTRILINHSNDVLKKRSRIIYMENPLASEILQACDPDTLGSMTFQEMIQSLPEEQRSIIVLRFINDYSLADIAGILELPLGTVKTRLYGGLKTLRVELQEVENE